MSSSVGLNLDQTLVMGDTHCPSSTSTYQSTYTLDVSVLLPHMHNCDE